MTTSKFVKFMEHIQKEWNALSENDRKSMDKGGFMFRCLMDYMNSDKFQVNNFGEIQLRSVKK